MTLEFLVRWKDYGEANNLWLPYQELRQNIKLHEYLRERGLHKLIPKEKDESQAGNQQARATRKRWKVPDTSATDRNDNFDTA